LTRKKILKDKLHLLLVDSGVADWIKVKEANFVLKPGESKDIHFEVNDPQIIIIGMLLECWS